MLKMMKTSKHLRWGSGSFFQFCDYQKPNEFFQTISKFNWICTREHNCHKNDQFFILIGGIFSTWGSRSPWCVWFWKRLCNLLFSCL
jgi:hypothetical protein